MSMQTGGNMTLYLRKCDLKGHLKVAIVVDREYRWQNVQWLRMLSQRTRSSFLIHNSRWCQWNAVDDGMDWRHGISDVWGKLASVRCATKTTV